MAYFILMLLKSDTNINNEHICIF